MDALPPVIGALGLAALFSAEVSSSDAILFMLATSLSQDLYRRFVHPEADERRMLTVARLAAVAGGALGTVIAIVAVSIETVLAVFYTLLTVSLFVPILAGLYTRRVGSPEALGAIAGGVSLFIVAQVAGGGARIAGWTPAMIGLAGAAVTALLVLAVRRPPRPESG